MAEGAPRMSPQALIRSVTLAREYGPEWVERLAAEIERTHRPDRSRLSIRWRWRVVPTLTLRPARCVWCGCAWICPDAAWAEGIVSTSRRIMGG
jgi:hypothetical protein